VTRRKRPGRGWVKQDERLFVLEVFIIGGPMTAKFLKKNKVVSRTIQIRGDQTLEDLHYAIFDTFDREDEHLYEFQVGGKGPMDPKAKKYVLHMAMDGPFGDKEPAGTVNAAIGSFGLQKGDAFGYWFDFGDDWWHQINVVAIEERAGRGRCPKVTNRVGKSPPQYVDWEEEDDA
jgi:hypothetical protein